MTLCSLRSALTIALTAAFISLLALAGKAAGQKPLGPQPPLLRHRPRQPRRSQRQSP
jgi:hypothetical protein